MIAAETEHQWAALANIIGGGIDQDARFKTGTRLQHRDELNAAIADGRGTKTHLKSWINYNERACHPAWYKPARI